MYPKLKYILLTQLNMVRDKLVEYKTGLEKLP